MAIFPKIHSDDVIQVSDKFRIDATKSWKSVDEAAVTLVEIEPESGSGFIAVQGSPIDQDLWYLDWEYATAGTKTVRLRITTDGSPVTITKSITCVDEATDKLFSKDTDLKSIETDILKFLPDYRSSYNYVHREAQKEMLEWLYTNGYTMSDNVRITKDEIVDIEEVRFWSKYMVMRMIYWDLYVSSGDVHKAKSDYYLVQEARWRDKAILKIDVDGDGTQGNSEGFSMRTKNFVRV